MQIHVDILNAFTKNGQGGNPAGVVIGIEGKTLSEADMLSVAKQVNLSETAFVGISDKADFRVRFFTPTDELDLCGHATIAAWTQLFHKGIIKPGKYTQEIQAGILQVNVLPDGRVIMDQTLPKFKKEIDETQIAEILGIPVAWIRNTKHTPQVVSTGLNDLLIPLDTREHLFAIQLNDDKISRFEKENGLDSFHLFTLDALEKNSIANSRSADPLHGIHEESATGSAHGALACYLFQKRIITVEKAMEGLVFEQGYSMQRPSEIFVRLDTQDGEITKVQVGGFAAITGVKEI